MDDPPAGRSAREDHADAEGRLMQLGSGFELDPGVRNEERDRSLAENVDLQILDLLRKHLLHMFGEGRHIALNGGPAVGGLLHFLRDVDQRLVLRIPDGRNLPWIQLEKALAVRLDQTGDRAPSLILVRWGPHHEPPGLQYRTQRWGTCSTWRSLYNTASVVPARLRSKGPMRPHLRRSSDPFTPTSLVLYGRIRRDIARVGNGRYGRILLATDGRPYLVDPGPGRVDSIGVRVVVR